MGGRVEIGEGWEGEVDAAVARLFDDRLGPAIASDAARYAPVETGELSESVEHHLEGQTLIISATGGAGDPPREYAADIELGHRVYHPSTGITGPEVVPPQPFLRPALYTERGDDE